ncbi:MAG: TRAP transporter small permease [Sandaracinaceae bacterium]
MDRLKAFDAGLARGEAAVATVFLLAMILAASAQALLRNLSESGLDAAVAGLTYLTWVDPFLQKGTLWLAFLGASLATREGRHIAIDLLPRLVPRRTKLALRVLTGLFAAVVSFFLARAFFAAVLVNAEEAQGMALYTATGDLVHVCEASAAELAAERLSAPGAFCAVRAGLALLGIEVQTAEAALELIVPVMFLLITIRLTANAVGAGLVLAGVLPDVEPPPVPEAGAAPPPEGGA